MNQHNQQHQAPALAGRRLITTREYKRRMGDPSEMKLWRDERRGIGPKPVRQNGRRYWFEDEVDAYLDELAATRSPLDEKQASTADDMEVHNGRTS
jgi:hypothetical protein